MKINQIEINELYELIKKKRFQTWHFEEKVIDNDTNFLAPKPIEGYFRFKNHKKGYIDPIKKINKYIVEFSPNGDNADEKEEYLIDFKACKEKFDEWLGLIKKEIDAKNKANEMNYNFKYSRFDENEIWTTRDQDNAKKYLDKIVNIIENESELNKNEITELKGQLKETLGKIDYLIGENCILSKKFVIQLIIGTLFNFALQVAVTNGPMIISIIIGIISSNGDFLDNAPRQSLIAYH